MEKLHIVFLDADSVGHDIAWPDFAELGRVTSYGFTHPHETAARVRDAEVLMTNKVQITAAHIEGAPKLRYIGTLATGYNQVDGEAAARRGIPVCNVPAYSTMAVAQHVFTLILALTSHICPLSESVRAGDWAKSLHFCYWHNPIVELDAKVMGLVGFGDTGSAVGRIAHAFGMQVLVYAPRPKTAPGYTPFAFVELDELFARSDVISLHCPLTSENRHMVNAARLALMKRDALLINTARGSLVDEQALREALEQGRIAGAGLDVVEEEPMPDGNPLRFAPRCLITPHVAWCSVEARTRLMQGVYDNLRNYLDGRPGHVTNMPA
ncbi:D-2-hydroxyacid dehydrogenase [Desulfovibrio sp. OttesenSCG-928-A18]|nr:D-2-hydroxyacid dehydrogenase [Desulfovibrio sp. OttesenSCG-928-A18]